MSVKSVKVTRSTVVAEVVVGENDYGSDVSVSVRLNTADPAVVEALEPLSALLVETASTHVRGSATKRQVQVLVREKLREKLSFERAQITKHLGEDHERRAKALQREVESAKAAREYQARLVEEKSRIIETLNELLERAREGQETAGE